MNIEGNRSSSGMFSQGDPISASKLNSLGLTADKGQTFHSSGAMTAQGNFGTVFLDNQTVQSEQQVFDYPFKVTVANDDTQGAYRIYVRAGLANNFVPTLKGAHGGDKPMDDFPAPYFKVTSVSMTKKKYVVLKVSKNSGSFYAANPEVLLFDSQEQATDTDNTGYLILASVTFITSGSSLVGTAPVAQYMYASQTVIRAKAGSSVPVFWSFTSR